MSKLNALTGGICAASMGVMALTQASMHPFSLVAFVMTLGSIAAAVFAGVCLASGEEPGASRQETEPNI